MSPRPHEPPCISVRKRTYARGQRVRDVDAVEGRLLDALEEVVNAVRVDGRLEVVEQLVLVVAQRPQELPLLVLGLDVRLSLGPARIKLQEWLRNQTLRFFCEVA